MSTDTATTDTVLRMPLKGLGIALRHGTANPPLGGRYE